MLKGVWLPSSQGFCGRVVNVQVTLECRVEPSKGLAGRDKIREKNVALRSFSSHLRSRKRSSARSTGQKVTKRKIDGAERDSAQDRRHARDCSLSLFEGIVRRVPLSGGFDEGSGLPFAQRSTILSEINGVLASPSYFCVGYFAGGRAKRTIQGCGADACDNAQAASHRANTLSWAHG